MPNDNLSMPVRTDIDPTLHPDAATRFADVLELAGGPGSVAYAEGREMLATIYEAIGRVNDTEKELLALTTNPKVEERHAGRRTYETGSFMDGASVRMRHGREAEFADAADRVLSRASRDYDVRYKRVATAVEDLGKRLEATLADPEAKTPRNVALATEARSYFRSLGKASERVAAFWKAAEAGDKLTVAAVLNAPPYLSGFEPKELDALRQGAYERLAPVELRQYQAAENLAESLRAAGSHLLTRRIAVSRTCEREAKSPRGRAEKALRELRAG